MPTDNSMDDYARRVELMQSHYYWLNLTFAQAEEVLRFEQLKGIRSGEEFTHWEELAFEADTFERILGPEQLALYQETHLAGVISYEEMLRADDAAATAEVERLQQRLAHCRDEFVPALQRVPRLLPVFIGPDPKIDLLLAEYEQFWREEQQRLLVRHYRKYRRYCPQILQARELRHSLVALLPHYHAFVAAADAPTRVVLEFVLEALRNQTHEQRRQLLGPYGATLRDFNRFLFQTERRVQFEPELPDWVFPFPSDERAWADQWSFTLLWLGRDPAALPGSRGTGG